MAKVKLSKNADLLTVFDFITRKKCTNGSGEYCMIPSQIIEVFRELLKREVKNGSR